MVTHEIEITRARKPVVKLTVQTEDGLKAWDVKENLDVCYEKKDGYEVKLFRQWNGKRQRIISVVGDAVFMMPVEAA